MPSAANLGPRYVDPLKLCKNCIALIEREEKHEKDGRPSFIVAKINALLDKDVIQALYRAARAGAHVELIVRGACALRPGMRGLSSRIRVRSIVGRFLEHSRIFLFGNGGESEVYLGSADWMPRNLHERVEVMFRLRDPALCQKVCAGILAPYLIDTEKSRFLGAQGNYTRTSRKNAQEQAANGTRFSVQDYFMGIAQGEDEDSVLINAQLEKLVPAPIAEFLTVTPPPASEAAD